MANLERLFYWRHLLLEIHINADGTAISQSAICILLKSEKSGLKNGQIKSNRRFRWYKLVTN